MYGNGYSYMPAVLVEVAFINNPVEEQLLKSDEFLEKAAVGIAKGILEHVDIDYMLKKDKSMEKGRNRISSKK
ncbi:N-acetylmuramoyl-L-alanine amidase family protein [Alkaliphilus flagellatus]